MKNVYAITTVRIIKVAEEPSVTTFWNRTVGLFPSLDRAEFVLQQNMGDLNESGYYPWAVIEEVEFGLYPDVDKNKTIYFEFNRQEKTWKQIKEIPTEFNHAGYEELAKLVGVG